MAKPKLTNTDFCRAAKRLRCDVAAIKAVAFVESRGEGFYSDGCPVILFERHKFKSFTQGRYNSTHPHLSGSQGGYGKAGQNQRNKFNQAFALNPTAAMKSCSWGKFQIMGFNYEDCGFASVGAFVDAMKESEGRQLDAFVEFVISNNLARHLRNLDWAAFARGYNGAGYKANRYDTKMASAYARFSKENIDCSNSAAASTAETLAEIPAGAAAGNPSSGPANTNEPPPIETKHTEETEIEKDGETVSAKTTTTSETVTLKSVGTSLWTKFLALLAAITGMGINAGTIIETRLSEITLNQVLFAAMGITLIVLAVFYYRKRQEAADHKDKMLIEKAADPQLNTVEMKRRGWIEWS